MAVQKSKKSRRVRDNGRAHHHMNVTTISTDSASGESHVRHHVSANGYYKGKKIIKDQEESNHIRKASNYPIRLLRSFLTCVKLSL